MTMVLIVALALCFVGLWLMGGWGAVIGAAVGSLIVFPLAYFSARQSYR